MIEVITNPTTDDWWRVRGLRLAALEDSPDAFWTTLDEEVDRPEPWWRARLENPQRLTVVGVHDGDDAGMMGCGPHHDDPSDAGLYGVWVSPRARGSGVAIAMLDATIGWARARGFRRLLLDVGDANARAVAFYDRAGFVPTGKRSHFPPPRHHVTEHERGLDL